MSESCIRGTPSHLLRTCHDLPAFCVHVRAGKTTTGRGYIHATLCESSQATILCGALQFVVCVQESMRMMAVVGTGVGRVV